MNPFGKMKDIRPNGFVPCPVTVTAAGIAVPPVRASRLLNAVLMRERS
jgi:hypothetical protein